MDKNNNIVPDSIKKTTGDAAVKISGSRNSSGTQNGYVGGDAAGSSASHQFRENTGERKNRK